MRTNKTLVIIKRIGVYLLITLLAISLFVIIFNIGSPRDISQLFNNNIYLMFLFSMFAFYFCARIKRAKPLITLLIIFILFTLPIHNYWSNAITTQKIIGGLIPHRDSMYYYLNARNVLNGNLFDLMTNGRSLFPAFLAFLVTLTGENIQAIIIILAVLCSFSFYFLLTEMQIEFGSIPAAIFMGGIYVFYSRWITQLMSEQMGVLLAMLGLALLIQGLRRQEKRTLFLGILISTLALNARVGAMFVLPALAVFMGYAFKKKRFSFTDFGWAAAAILLGFLINTLVFQLLSDPGIMPYSSFANAIYGQSKGGAGWTSIQKDFPGLTDSNEILNLALMNIKRYPLGLVIGTIKAYRDFFLPGIDNAFVFITGYGSTLGIYLLWAMAWFLTGYELFRSIRNIKNPFCQFELLVFAGILLSVPFAPPRDSGSMRTYAATIPFLMLLPVSGLTHLLDKMDLIKIINKDDVQTSYPKSMLAFSIILISVIVLTPIIIKLLVKPVSYLNNECPTGQTPAVFHLNQGSYITLIPDGSTPCAGTPDICFSKFISSASGGVNELYDVILETIRTSKEAVIFSAVNDLNTGKYFYVLLNQKKLPAINADSQTISACLKEINRPEFLYSATTINNAEIIIN